MIPLKDSIPSKRFPFVNWSIILLNVYVFIIETKLNDIELSYFLSKYALIPAKVLYDFNFANTSISTFIPFFSSMFLHGGIGHIIGNMWFLYVFGDNIEDKMGHFKYLVFYILCGLMAAFTHFMLYSNSNIPTLGASGAISGIMAAYMFMFPGSKIITFIPVFIILPFLIQVPALIFIGIWFIGQIWSGTLSLFHGMATGIAFWAHIGGFIGGWFFYRFFVKKRQKEVELFQ